MDDIEKKWTDLAMSFLKGKTITKVRYLTKKEAKDFMWDSRPVVIIFTDGSYIIPSRDDEGNDGGSLFTSEQDGISVMPTIKNF